MYVCLIVEEALHDRSQLLRRLSRSCGSYHSHVPYRVAEVVCTGTIVWPENRVRALAEDASRADGESSAADAASGTSVVETMDD